MKKRLSLFLAIAVLLTMAGCRNDAGEIDIPIGQTQPPKTETTLEFGVRYIRTNGSGDIAGYPKVQMLHSAQDLKDYYTIYHELYDLERHEEVSSDTTMGFLDACDRYDEAFFGDHYLVFVLLEEGSGSIRHEVAGVKLTAQQKLSVSIDRRVPQIGTDDMANWHIILELPRMADLPADVLVYLDGRLAYDGAAVEQAQPDGQLSEPPAAILHTPEGTVSLTPAGYSWTVQKPDGTAVTTIADQTARPLPADSVPQAVIGSQYAGTIYAPVPEGGYEATNSLGYQVKLAWDVTPASVTYTCWAEGSTAQRDVISHDTQVFYAWSGGHIYEIAATWTGYGTVSYYVYITDDVHTHMTALRPQTVDDPVTGYCGNTTSTLYIGDRAYSFIYGYSVTLTDILVNLDYDPDRICRCMAQYRADTEFGSGYQIHLDYGFVRCEKGQADLTVEQVAAIREIIEWAEATNCRYPEPK